MPAKPMVFAGVVTMSGRGPKTGYAGMTVAVLRAGCEVVAGAMRLAVGRHVAFTILGGTIVGFLAFTSSPLWVFEGMLLAQILGLLVDTEAGRALPGAFDRIDHAGFVAVLALLLHLGIAASS